MLSREKETEDFSREDAEVQDMAAEVLGMWPQVCQLLCEQWHGTQCSHSNRTQGPGMGCGGLLAGKCPYVFTSNWMFLAYAKMNLRLLCTLTRRFFSEGDRGFGQTKSACVEMILFMTEKYKLMPDESCMDMLCIYQSTLPLLLHHFYEVTNKTIIKILYFISLS